MIAYAAIDLRGGRVVQLIGGRPEHERISLPDPVAITERWQAAGFAALHVVDLDAALGDGDNRSAVTAILSAARIPVQFGGGIRRRADIDARLTEGAAAVIVGTRAVTDPEWLEAASSAHPGRIVVAADVREEAVVTHGWTADSGALLPEFLDRLTGLPLAGLLVTDVGREGQLTGIDVELFERIAERSDQPLIAAGGIAAIEDLRSLDAAGCAGAVVGTALYTGAVEARAVAEEFNQ